MRHLRNLFRATAILFLTCVGLLPAYAGTTVAEMEAADGICHGHLIFCNEPEKIRMAGAYADTILRAGHEYTIFFHYRCQTYEPGDFVVALHGSPGQRFRFVGRQGFADPQRDPPLAGRQAMARYLTAAQHDYRGIGGARFGFRLAPGQVASGILNVCCEGDARMRIYFKHDKWSVPHSNVTIVDGPRREQTIDLTVGDGSQIFRIGNPEQGTNARVDGAYGVLYAFHIKAPPGRRVRVSFSPRGGKGGLVGSLGGTLLQTNICPATHWAVYCETKVGADGVRLTTAPFGGVFYPVELVFRLL